MSTLTPERSTIDASSASQASKPQRILACVLCSQRKIKCDRSFPCKNCVKSKAQCVPATIAPRRPRCRPADRELLERLHKYEDLLRQNNIDFESFQAEKESPKAEEDGHEQPRAVEAGCSSPSTSIKSEATYTAKNLWLAMSHVFLESDNGSNESVVKTAWDELSENNQFLLFSSRKTAVDLSTLHPEPIEIFKLWQIYLDNVNPLLKVIHATSLQGRIIEAASNAKNISPNLEALMFSIYCMSIFSLTADDCQNKFSSSKDYLLTKYQFGCQQALLNSRVLRTTNRDCLTALYLYLVSIGNFIDPQSLASILGIAFRIAQRMGIHSESALARHTPLEAEMRRRLWWAFTLFDTRIGEIAHPGVAECNDAAVPTWDCKIPLNVNDCDLRQEMKEPPTIQGNSTEALFAVVRSELWESVRHTNFHLDLATLDLNPAAKKFQHGITPKGAELDELEKMMEEKYLKFCDPENPLHFMTIWTVRGYLARYRLVEHYFKYCISPTSSVHQTESQRNAALSHAFEMLKCDTKITTSPLTKRYLWLTYFYFPFPAYIQIIQHMRRQPVSKHTEQSWEIMSENYEARFASMPRNIIPLFKVFSKVILQGWEAREAALRQLGEPVIPPRIVSSIQRELARLAQNAQNANTKERPDDGMDIDMENFIVSMPMGFGADGLLCDIGVQEGYAGIGLEAYPDIPLQGPLGSGLNQVDWASMDWNMNERRG